MSLSCFNYDTVDDLTALLDDIYTYNKEIVMGKRGGQELTMMHYTTIQKKSTQWGFEEGKKLLIVKGTECEDLIKYFKPKGYKVQPYYNIEMDSYLTSRTALDKHKDDLVQRIAYALWQLELGIY